MMKHNILSARILSIALTMSMLFGMMPASVFATEGNTPFGASNTVCHVAHDKNCGFTKDIEGAHCSHKNENDTYSCVSGDNVATPGNTSKFACTHEDGCTYVAAVKGVACKHICEKCAVKDSGVSDRQPAQKQTAYDKVLGLFAALPNASEITAETTEEKKDLVFTLLTAAMDAFAALTAEEQDKFVTEQEAIYTAATALNDVIIGARPAPMAAALQPRTTPLDFTSDSISYECAADGGAKTANPKTDSIIDTNEGWSWDQSTSTLTLSGLTMNITANTLNYAINLPRSSKVILADDTTNKIENVYTGSEMAPTTILFSDKGTIDGQAEKNGKLIASIAMPGAKNTDSPSVIYGGITIDGGDLSINSSSTNSRGFGTSDPATIINGGKGVIDVKHAAFNNVPAVGKYVNFEISGDYQPKASWTSAIPTISFAARNGNTISDATVDKANGTITLPDSPQWEGYTFDGWYTGVDGTDTEVTDATEYTADATIYAKWMKGSQIVCTERMDLSAMASKDMSTTHGWKWDADTQTLELNGFIYDATHMPVQVASENYEIKLPERATLKATGKNTVTARIAGGADSHTMAIYGTGAFIINGTGTLDVKANMTAIATDTGDITISEATVNAEAIPGGINKNSTIATGGKIIIQDSATVSSKASYVAIFGGAGIVANGAKVTGGKDMSTGEDFVSGTTKQLSQTGTDPVVISFGPSITLETQVGTASYGTAASPTFAVNAGSFGDDKYPAFNPSIAWTSGSTPTGVTAAFSDDKTMLTLTTTAASPAGEYKFKVVSAKADSGNYESAEATLKVEKLNATITWGATDLPYNGSAQAPTATVSNKVGSDDVTVTVTGAQTDVGIDYIATAEALAGTAAGNYTMPPAKPTTVFCITKAAYAGTAAAAPDASKASKTATSVTLAAQTITGETVEYGYSTTASGAIIWQDDDTFTSLAANTQYYFFARVKETATHAHSASSSGTAIKTDKNDADKIVDANKAIDDALKALSVSNTTDANAIFTVANNALANAGITGVTLEWSTSFSKTEASEETAGKITGAIKLSCGAESNTVEFNKTISMLPSDPAEKNRLVKAAIEAALNAYTATNTTTADDIKNIVDKANADSGITGVTVAWKTPSDFNRQASTDSANGKVTGTLSLSCTTHSGSATATISVNRPIERSNEQKLADAKSKAVAALATLPANNDMTADGVLTAINNALYGTGVTADWKIGNAFAKTLATKNASGLITGVIELALNGKKSEASVNLTIAMLPGDKKVLTDATTEANNAKSGIAVSGSAASSIASGTKFVTAGEMKALTDAIAAAQIVVNKPNASEAEIVVAAAALNNALKTFNAAIKTGTYTAPSGGNSSTSGGSTGGSSGKKPTPPAAVPPSNTQTKTPTTVETKISATVDKNNNAIATVTDKIMQDAIDKAVAQAKKNGTSANGISVIINVTTGDKAANTITANLPKTVQEKAIAGNVLNIVIVVDRPDISINLQLDTIKEINKQAKADVQLSATRLDNSKLSEEAKTALGDRPTFDLKATYADGSKAVSDFGTGNVIVKIPYTLQNGESVENVQAVFVDANGKVEWLKSSSYDANAKLISFNTNHFSVYGVGYKQSAPNLTDTAKPQPDTDNTTETSNSKNDAADASNSYWWIWLVVALLVAGVGGYILYRKKFKA